MATSTPRTAPPPSPYGVVVKGADGKFRVWRDGSWQELPSAAASASTPVPVATPGVELPSARPAATEPAVPPAPVQPPPAPQHPSFGGAQAAHYFSAAEESEARQVAQRLDTAAAHKRYGINKIVSHVVGKLSVPLPAEAASRLPAVALTFLRGTRSAVDFSAALVRAPAEGGVGLPAEAAAAIAVALTAIGSRIRAEGGEVIDEGRAAPAQPPTPSVSPAAPVAHDQSLTPPPAVPVVAPPPAAAPVAKPRPRPEPAVIPPAQPVTPKPATPAPSAPPSLAPATPPPLWRRPIGARQTGVRLPTDTGRPQLADVRHPEAAARPHAVGPIDELKTLDLETFRYLGATPVERSARIIEKVNALGQESLARRAEGVAAWRASEVYTTYRQIGIESMHTGRPVSDVSAERERRGTPTLSEAEFNAIADLNQQLRF